MTIPLTLLSYALSTSPFPMQASPSSTAPSPATLTFVVSCPRDVHAAEVAQIMIRLPVQQTTPDPTDLVMTAPPLSAASIASSGAESWQPSAGALPGVFIFKPNGGPVTVSAQSLTITITGINIGLLVGTAVVKIEEWAATGSGTPPLLESPPSGITPVPIAKFPPGFFASDFSAGHAAVGRGETVTLSWTASDNAAATLTCGDQDPVDVSKLRSWSSPALYDTTVFLLSVSAMQNGQTVGFDLPPVTVEVSYPKVIEFYCDPAEVGYNQPVTLHWRTEHADGATFLTGRTKKEKLSPVSDPASPKIITPQYGQDYSLQATRTGVPASELVDLDFTFIPLSIHFKADPPAVRLDMRSTVLTWTVENATSVLLDGKPVKPSDSARYSPTRASTTYTLMATWVDGSVQTVPIEVTAPVATLVDSKIEAQSRNDWTQSNMYGQKKFITQQVCEVAFHLQNANGFHISNARFQSGGNSGDWPTNTELVGQNSDAFRFRFTGTLETSSWLGFIPSTDVSLILDYDVDGVVPTQGRGVRVALS